MSGYLCLDCDLVSTDLLTKALKELGLEHTQHEPPVHLQGFSNDERPQLAHIVVPKASLNKMYTGCSNDLGFLYDPGEKKYNMYVSSYDASHEVHKRVKQAYIVVGVREQFENEGMDTSDSSDPEDLQLKKRKDVTVLGRAII